MQALVFLHQHDSSMVINFFITTTTTTTTAMNLFTCFLSLERV